MAENKGTEKTTFALCGKGGVGKTTISAALVRLLSEDKSKKVLAIDADPAIGLSTALGFEPDRTVDNIRNDLIDRVGEGETTDRESLIEQLDYEVFEALGERDNIAFLAIGRPEKAGCYCSVNSFLKDIISSISEGFDYVVIDGEAGIEQVNRRVMETVDHLLVVSDLSHKGLAVAETIAGVSEKAIEYASIGLIVNRLREGESPEKLKLPPGLNLFCGLPESDDVRNMDIAGRSVFSLEAPAVLDTLQQALASLGNRN